MSEQPHLEILPPRSLGGRRWDIVCACVLFLPLVLMAFQGDIVFGIAERIDYNGRYTTIHQRERELVEVEKTLADLETERATLDLSVAVQQVRNNEIRVARDQAKIEIEDLKREIKARRTPLDAETRFWNFSAVKRWQLLLLLGPLMLSLLWFGMPVDQRGELFRAGTNNTVRWHGLLVSLGGAALFWLGAWQQSELGRHINQYDYVPTLLESAASTFIHVSLIAWSVGAVYSFGGPKALLRVWLPMAVAMFVMVLNYGSMSTWWADAWDQKEAWSYGYFIGPIAAMLFCYKLSEVLHLPGEQHLSLRPTAAEAAERDARLPWHQRGGWRVLALWAAVVLVVTAGVYLLSGRTGHRLSFQKVIYFPVVIGAVIAALAIWQWREKDRRAELAMRLVGVTILLVSIAFRWKGQDMGRAYFQHTSMVGVLIGGTLAALGFQVFRVMWVPLAFLYLAIPWPERTYVDMAQVPQAWAAQMAEKFMLMVGYTVSRDDNTLTVLPGPEGTLSVAEKCSGLKMLFAFVALSVVYAYISRRSSWRRAVIFASSFPIAIVANFARVIAMALATRWGYRQIAQEGLQHTMTGFVVMLPLAFFLLYLEMRVLDGIERLADLIVGEDPPTDGDSGSADEAPADAV